MHRRNNKIYQESYYCVTYTKWLSRGVWQRGDLGGAKITTPSASDKVEIARFGLGNSALGDRRPQEAEASVRLPLALILTRGSRRPHAVRSGFVLCWTVLGRFENGSKCNAADAFGLFHGAQWRLAGRNAGKLSAAGVKQRFQSCHAER